MKALKSSQSGQHPTVWPAVWPSVWPAVWPTGSFRFLSRLSFCRICIFTLRGQARWGGRYALDTERPCLYLPSGRLGSVFEGKHGYLCEITLSGGTWLHIWRSQYQSFHTLQVPLASRNAQHLLFNLPSKPAQGQTLNDPNKCHPVVPHPPLSWGTKSMASRWAFPCGHQAGEQRDSVGRMPPWGRGEGRSSHRGGSLAVKSPDIRTPHTHTGKGGCRDRHSLVLSLATPQAWTGGRTGRLRASRK